MWKICANITGLSVDNRVGGSSLVLDGDMLETRDNKYSD